MIVIEETAIGPTILPIRFPGTDAPLAAMSLAAAGDMGFGNDGNRFRRNLWLREAGFDPDSAAVADLVHSRIVIEADHPGKAVRKSGRAREADGLVSGGRRAAVPGTTMVSCLVITVADCMPIFLYDAGTGAFGLLHSGWKGTGILSEAVSMMERLYGTRNRDVAAIFGPRIGACCYHVDEARAAEFAGEFGPAAVVSTPEGQSLDLVAANLGIADRLGLGSVEVVEGCTFCDERFGSFRRQGAGCFTRMAAVIGYPSVAVDAATGP